MRIQSLLKVVSRSVRSQALCTKATLRAAAPKPAPKPEGNKSSGVMDIASVTGVSDKVMSVPDSEVGPGASKSSAYKNPEYYCYNPFSYAEAEVEMLKFRLPQPSSTKTQ